jgi:hypothetical protein
MLLKIRLLPFERVGAEFSVVHASSKLGKLFSKTIINSDFV